MELNSASPARVESDERAAPLERPLLSVYALTEFVFCRRAGIVAVENDWQNEPDPAPLRLDFYLPHDLADLEHRLNRTMNRLWLWTSLAILAAVVALIALWRHETVIAVCAVGAGVLVSAPLRRHVEATLLLLEQRRDLLAWQAKEPAVDGDAPRPIDWRDFVCGDWMKLSCQEAYRDDGRGLVGKPWCLVRRRGMTIPVWKLPQAASTATAEIFPQHRVRMAAYCHLVESCEGRQCPCGIILFGNSYRGETMPFDSAARERLWMEYDAACATLAMIREDDRCHPAPPPPSLCSGCPCGAPRPYRELESEFLRDGEPIPVYGVTSGNGKLYHSACGDRFAWTPPHERARSLKIV